MAQKKRGKSLQDLGKLMSTETEQKAEKPAHHSYQNFYSFLHKRNRFYEDEVVLKEQQYNKKLGELNPEKSTVLHKKFEMKKINISNHKINRKSKPNNGFKEEIKYLTLDNEFKGWESNGFYSKFVSRHEQNAKKLTNDKLKSGKGLQLKPDWRLAIGLGSGSVFETSITLHHVYGFPYIPASAVKGVLRSYLITTLFGECEEENEPLLNAEFRAFQNESFCEIFGCSDRCEEVMFDSEGNPVTEIKKGKEVYKKEKAGVALKNKEGKSQEHQGNIVFFDAYPVQSPRGKIKADIMNPHYPDYYGAKNLPPADWQSPVPIIFLTVEGLEFQFMVGLRKGIENYNISLAGENGDILTVVAKLLKEALTNHGIGAKTAVGYGYMSES